jgi:hypothetical protein
MMEVRPVVFTEVVSVRLAVVVEFRCCAGLSEMDVAPDAAGVRLVWGCLRWRTNDLGSWPAVLQCTARE